ncbi:MAG TPA: right-handed parallel beta-helix repeat-containing protein [Ktedonobacteraceae bacterium]|nr:right-handed parallel beta-helix repeat-containing protein [Ktedonobacteraceae bacterium]
MDVQSTPQRPCRSRPRMLRSWALPAILVLFVMMLLSACGGPGASTSSGPTINLTYDSFSPKEMHIKAGQTVTWTNNGQIPHTVTADDGSFDSGELSVGQTYSHTFTKPGRYAYYCRMHGAAGGYGMAGVLIVDGTTANQAHTTSSANNLSVTLAGPRLPLATLRVPEDYPTIQAAVKAAHPGDLVSIAPGTYHEAVTVNIPNITVRGRNRQQVILDGNFQLGNGFTVVANNVVLENMTARYYIGNGFYWTGVKGFRGSYLTAYSNGDYGIYAYNSSVGQFDHDLGAGSPDAGFYVGACHPCHVLVTHVLSEGNALGFSGTNAGGDLVLRDSIWRNNRTGLLPNSLDSEPNPPQDGATILNNLIENNNNSNAPAKDLEYPAFGSGIIVAGGNDNVIQNNRVSGHFYYGILVTPYIDQKFYEPHGNTVKNNTITNSGVTDLALAALSSRDNCFSDNTVSSTNPPFLQFTHACGSLGSHGGGGDPSILPTFADHIVQVLMNRVSAPDWKTAPVPTDLDQQPGLPDLNGPLQGIFTSIEGTSLNMTPSATTITPSITLGGLGLHVPFIEVILGFYMYYLPLALYAALLSVATWDIVRRTSIKGGASIGWLAIIFLIPVLGPLAYYLFGRSEISRTTRLALAIGAPVLYLVIAILLLLLVS